MSHWMHRKEETLRIGTYSVNMVLIKGKSMKIIAGYSERAGIILGKAQVLAMLRGINLFSRMILQFQLFPEISSW